MTFRMMRVCVTGMYFEHFFAFLDAREDLSYEATLDECRKNGLLYPGGLKAELEKFGVTMLEVLVDAPKLQTKWLRENNPVLAAQPFDLNEVFFEQLCSFKPDVVYFQTFFSLAPQVRRRIKTVCPSVRIVCGHRGFPIFDCSEFADVDAAFLGYPRFHEHWHKVGVKTFYHLHCFDEQLLPAVQKKAAEIEPIDLSFVGTTGWGSNDHEGRYLDLRRVLRATNLVVYGFEIPKTRPVLPPVVSGLRPMLRRVLLGGLQRLPESALFGMRNLGERGVPGFAKAAQAALRWKRYGPDVVKPIAGSEEWYWREPKIGELFPDRMRPPRFGVDYFAVLAASKITWNRHQSTEGAGANMRLFEGCGVGTCQLSDDLPEVTEVYEPDKEILVYQTIDECIEKARWLLDHPAERAKIAKAGQERTMREHTVKVRAPVLYQHLTDLLKGKS